MAAKPTIDVTIKTAFWFLPVGRTIARVLACADGHGLPHGVAVAIWRRVFVALAFLGVKFHINKHYGWRRLRVRMGPNG
jgi:hypothetical protein